MGARCMGRPAMSGALQASGSRESGHSSVPALAQSPNFSAYNLLPDPVLVIDRDSIILFANEVVAEVLLLDPIALVGQDLDTLMPPAYHVSHKALTQDFRAEKPSGSTVVGSTGRLVEVVRGDGTNLMMRLSVTASADGKHFIGMLCDMSRYVADVRQREQDFMAHFAHECRNNLQALYGAMDLLRFCDTLEQVQELLPMAQAGSRRMLQLLISSARASALDVNAHSLQLAWVQDAALFKAVESAAQTAAAEARLGFDADDTRVVQVSVRFQQDAEHEGAAFHVDLSSVCQIVGQLVSNAVRYAVRLVQVTVCLKASAPTRAEVLLKVEDDGPGMSDKDQALVFEKHQRLRTGDDTVHGGCGLGLYIARKLAHAHDGDVTVQSPAARTGCGCLFTACVRASVRPTTEQPRAAVLEELDSLRILIVDDSTSAAKLFAAMLKGLCSSETDMRLVHSATACTVAAAEFQPHLIFLDEHMPDGQGSELIPGLQSTLPSCTIVSLTGDPSIVGTLLAVGAHQVLIKPAGRFELRHVLTCYPQFHSHIVPVESVTPPSPQGSLSTSVFSDMDIDPMTSTATIRVDMIDDNSAVSCTRPIPAASAVLATAAAPRTAVSTF